MTPAELIQKYGKELTFLPLIDTETNKAWQVVFSFTVEGGSKERVTIITERHELIADPLQPDGWRHAVSRDRLFVDHNTKVSVVDENGVPKTITVQHITGYHPYAGPPVGEGEPVPVGEPIWEPYEQERHITEWYMLYWGLYKQAIEPSLMFGILRKVNIAEYQGQPVPPLQFVEPNQA